MVTTGSKPDFAIYNVLVNSHFKDGKLRKELELFKYVLDCGPDLDIVTYNTVICGYCSMRMLDEAVHLFAELKKRQTGHNTITLTILIQVFCKGGKLDVAVSFIL
ncbi:unnamed protein product [Cuscuta epithymum]|uniref:Pentatricopeptide repeat-containing protein n=1 Tax=Cuscuta epithymum TaxID=186058 RepID=A0AAV0DZR7_9ASTE|nr:unnamed protein product [Cuscuta epithymum]